MSPSKAPTAGNPLSKDELPPDGCLVARRELSFGRADLSARQSAAEAAADARAHQAAAAWTLGHDARTEFYLCASEPRHQGARPGHDLYLRARATAGRALSRIPISRAPTARSIRTSRKTKRACSGCSSSSPFPAAFRATPRPRRRARSTKAASSATRCRMPMARRSTIPI